MTNETVRLVVDVDARELWSNVFGSGFETYPWWDAVEYYDGADWDTPGSVRLWVIDPDTGESEGRGTVTVFRLAEAVSKLPHIASRWHDMDADDADQVLQMAILGEVRFG